MIPHDTGLRPVFFGLGREVSMKSCSIPAFTAGPRCQTVGQAESSAQVFKGNP